jgi:hypothetical protein
MCYYKESPFKLRDAIFQRKHPLGDCRDWAERVIERDAQVIEVQYI